MTFSRLFVLCIVVTTCCLVSDAQALVRFINVTLNVDVANTLGRPSVAELRNLSATGVRIEYKDYSTGQPQQFPLYDQWVTTYHNAGIRILMILDYASIGGTPLGGSTSDWENYIPKFVQRATQVVSHYKGQVFAYEIWNEQDLPQTEVPVPQYAKLLEQTFTAIKNIDPRITVVVGGLASGNPAWVTKLLQASNGKFYADTLGVHPYGQRPSPNWPSPTWGFGLITTLLQNYLNVLPPNTPLWITEVGTDDLNVQGEFPSRTFEALNSWKPALVPYVCWFCFSDGMVNPFGLVTTSLNPKASYYSYQQFARIPPA